MNASAITAGTMATARLGSGTASSTTILYGDQTYKTEPAAGITGADTWRITASFVGDVCPISSNWERQDTDAPGQIGSAMAVSSGIWTFPTTGIWEITFNHTFSASTDNQYIESRIEATVNDGVAWSNASKFWAGATGNGVYNMAQCKMLFDVTDVSNDKIRICTDSQDTDATTQAATDQNLTYVIFVRLGDT